MTARNPAHLATVLVLALFAPGAGATIYKCSTDGGGVFYQDAPCKPGRELRDFDRDPATVSVVPFGAAPPASPPKPRGSRAAEKPPAAKGTARPPSKIDAKARKPVVDARQRRFLRPGMSEGEVLARAGPPDVKTRVHAAVRWTYMPVIEDDQTMTTLTFDRGLVADVERRIIR